MIHFLLLPLIASQALGYCPPAGPVLSVPKIPKTFKPPALMAALEALNAGSARLNTTETSFSISMTSLDSVFLDFHHTAPSKNSSGVKVVDNNTVYRVASNTKLFVALAMLLEFAGKLDDAIGKYIPELKNNKAYEYVTLRLLASHMAGVPRDGVVFDRYTMVGPQLEKLGFPTPSASEVPSCDTGPGARPCSREEFFADLTNDNLTSPPGERSAYSNQGFNLLGFALQAKTGKSFQDVISDDITAPLGLTSTTFVAPPPSKAIIPAGDSSVWYDLDISNFKATAGLYSTPGDISTFLRSILTSKLLPPSITRTWLKPTSFTSNNLNMNGASGMPWEIFRVPLTNRVVDLYTKSGDIAVYAAYAVLIPEFGVGVAIHAAGAQAFRASAELLDLVATKLVPELEGLAREQAEREYAGTYTSKTSIKMNETAVVEDKLVLVVDEGPGLKIQNWTRGGKDVFAGLAVLRGVKKASEVEARLYPVVDGRWRMVMETPEKGTGLLDTTCQSWMKVDQFRYAGLPVDEFVFQMGRNGEEVESVMALGLRQTFVREL